MSCMAEAKILSEVQINYISCFLNVGINCQSLEEEIKSIRYNLFFAKPREWVLGAACSPVWGLIDCSMISSSAESSKVSKLTWLAYRRWNLLAVEGWALTRLASGTRLSFLSILSCRGLTSHLNYSTSRGGALPHLPLVHRMECCALCGTKIFFLDFVSNILLLYFLTIPQHGSELFYWQHLMLSISYQ